MSIGWAMGSEEGRNADGHDESGGARGELNGTGLELFLDGFVVHGDSEQTGKSFCDGWRRRLRA